MILACSSLFFVASLSCFGIRVMVCILYIIYIIHYIIIYIIHYIIYWSGGPLPSLMSSATSAFFWSPFV